MRHLTVDGRVTVSRKVHGRMADALHDLLKEGVASIIFHSCRVFRQTPMAI
jgi:hypothetical protein